MKTTLDLDDALLKAAKANAAKQGISLRSYIETALKALMLPKARGLARPDVFRFNIEVIQDEAPPSVDIADRDALYDFMENRK